MSYQEKRLTGNDKQDLGDLLCAITINKHFLSNGLAFDEYIAIDLICNQIMCNLYSYLCNIFSKSADQEVIKQQIKKMLDQFMEYGDQISEQIDASMKRDDLND